MSQAKDPMHADATGVEPNDTTDRAVSPTVKDKVSGPPVPESMIPLVGRVLLVEDGQANARFSSMILTRAGAEVTLAENGQEAVDAVLPTLSGDGQPPFDLILMDMDMPVLNGIDAVQRLRQGGYQGPIVALTGLADHYGRQMCLDAGCDAHVTKPIDRESLLNVLADRLQQPTT